MWLRSPPVDGKANAELIDIIAATIGCRRSDVTIRTGASGTRKLIEITGPTDMIVSP